YYEPFWRPFLGLSKEELKKYAARQDIPFRDDSSNVKLDYSRNRIRHIVLKELEALFPGASHRIAMTSIEAADIAEFAKVMLEEELKKSGGYLSGRWLSHLPFGVALQVLSEFIRLNSKSHIQLSRSILYTLLDRVTESGQNDGRFCLEISGGCRVIVKNGNIICCQTRQRPYQNRSNQHRRSLIGRGLNALLEPGARLETLVGQKQVKIENRSLNYLELELFSPALNDRVRFDGSKKNWKLKELLRVWKKKDNELVTYDLLRINRKTVGIFDGECLLRPSPLGEKVSLGEINQVLMDLPGNGGLTKIFSDREKGIYA
ncbi:MAG: hypothetical protein HQK54_03415, partial [Oligoflexales bacterium]|nr:hypothetical protein [Oligoflexales bacterium]